MAARGFNYLGTIDDVVELFPWNFRINHERLNHTLAVQLICGREILLNDGYLVNHPIARAALLQRDTLLWYMIDAGFVHVMSRGEGRFGLHEMPERMAPMVESFRRLVDDKLDVKWADVRPRLEELDTRLRTRAPKNIIPWPRLDAGSGFRVLTQRLVNSDATPSSVGLGRCVREIIFRDFLDRFLTRMYSDTSGARTYWQILAENFANNPSYTRRPKEFLRGMMNLANEIYHYNMGIMLAAEHDGEISVETQASDAFDDLLLQKDIYLEDLPASIEISVPKVILTAGPAKLVKVLDPFLPVGEARIRWHELRAASEARIKPMSEHEKRELEEAAKRYARELAAYLGPHVSYSKAEGLLGFAVGQGVSHAKGAVVGGLVGIGAGATIAHLGGTLDGAEAVAYTAAGAAAGYGFSVLQKKAVGMLTRKFRVVLLKNQVIPPEIVQRSKQIVEQIKTRRVPSAIVLDRITARALAANITAFDAT